MPTPIQRFRHILTRPRAMALFWLLIVSVVLAGMPTLTIHAHSDAAVGHHHDVSGLHHDPEDAQHDQSREAQVPATAFDAHVHEASTVAFASLRLSTLEVSTLPHAAPPARNLVRGAGPPSPPLHRPPIA